MFNKHRLEALSDGIFAIVMTLLVLDLKIPEGVLPQHFAMHLTQEFLSFFITFAIASIFWTLQHRVFGLVDGVDRRLMIPTFLFLGFVSLLPFSSSLLGHRPGVPASFIVYYGNLLLVASSLTLKLTLAVRDGRIKPGPECDAVRTRLYTMCFVMVTGILSSIFLPISVVWVLPAALGILFRRLRKRKEDKLISEHAPLSSHH